MKNAISAISLFLGLLGPMAGYSTEAPEVVIGVFDSGIDITHPLLANHMWINSNEIDGDGEDNDRNGIRDDIHGVNWVDKTGNLADDHPDGHGTHVAGIILGFHEEENRSQHRNIKLISFKINLADPGTSLLKSLEYAQAQGVSIFHLSYVQPEIRIPTTEEVKRMTQAEQDEKLPWIEAFYRQRIIPSSMDDFAVWYRGYLVDCKIRWQHAMEKIEALRDTMLIITSVGNRNQNLNDAILEPATLSSSNVISVMNLDHTYQRYSDPVYGSDYGSQKVLVSAVGENVRSSVPRHVSKTGWLELSGSSQAAPKITHRLALIALSFKARNITSTPALLKQELFGELAESNLLKLFTITGKYLRD